ncbi:MAG: hypothetical protein KatS3mg105_2303 [Gemmatales bacterium]|nr:MAG: hypothetical protein KatS3mg105_2303 [Gemmatales bacterium]
MSDSRMLHLVLTSAITLALMGAAGAQTETSDEEILRSVGMSTEGDALLQFVRNQIQVASNTDQIKEMIRKLGDDSFQTREQATNELIALGRVALPHLQAALKDSDLEIVRRAEKCIEKIQQGVSLTPSVIRLLGKKKPVGTAKALLSYLPYAEDAATADEIRTALVQVAVNQGKAEPLLVEALSDEHPVVRASAAEVLCRAKVVSQREKIKELLKDPVPDVRLRTALALARLKEKSIVPVLIELLGQLPPEKAWQAEDLLVQLAGDDAPHVALGRDEAGRKKCRDAWADWWRQHEGKFDPARLAETRKLLGYTLLVMLDQGRVFEVDQKNKVRWSFNGVQFPLDVQYLRNGHILLAEMNADRVTERDQTGKTIWSRSVPGPLMAQRLPSGNTFIANRVQLLEVDKTGKEIWTLTPPNGETVMRAKKLRTGEIALITADQNRNTQNFVLLDSKGKVIRRFPMTVDTSGGRIDVLPNGNVIVPQMNQNRIVEYNRQGKIVWEASVNGPIVATRLPNGNTLVTCMHENRAVEIDRQGKEVWEYKGDTRINRALRR